MLLLDNTSKSTLNYSIKNKYGISLSEAFSQMYKILKEDSEHVDFDSFQSRCNWALSKISDSRDTILRFSDSEKFQEMFKNVTISESDNKLVLSINNNEVTGNSKILAVTLIMYAFSLYTNFATMGDNLQKIGGALIEKYSETLTLELGKRCDLSIYSLNGDVFRNLGQMIHNVNPFINIVVSVLCMLLIKKNFDKGVQSLVLLTADAVKSQVPVAIGYIYTVLTKSTQFLSVDFEFLAKDIYYQFKVLVPKV